MNKKLLLIVLGLILVVAGALTYVMLAPNNDSARPYETSQSTSSESPAPSKQISQPGKYIDYSSEAVRTTSGTKLLFFHAPWCPQCRQIEESINKNGIPAGVTVFKIDYDSNQALRQKYGVTIQTTFVKIDDNGNKIASYVAYEEPNFSSVERELLP